MTACKVSIIVPVYNTSKYLKNCIDSLLAQTLNEIEIIAVNDGSTDKSFEILKEYQALYPNKVYVYNTENMGVSHARNFGVTKSSGQYLWFVDSDDSVEPNACEELYNKATKDNNGEIRYGARVDDYKAANETITKVQDAINKVSTQRSALGALQNRLEHTVANLDNVSENSSSAESRIRDTDMAEEMVNYSKNNILAQAGQSMLAQANQSTQGVLSLLQ